MVTMRQVASAAGVSQKTVSRVFNEDAHVSPETRERVLAVLNEVDYTPNTLATTFRSGRAPVVGVAVPDVVDPFFGAIARAVDATAAEHDMSTLVTSIGNDPEREKHIVESLLRRSPSGLVLASVRSEQSYLKRWADKLPIVFVDRRPSGVTADSFTEDDVQGAYTATKHLLEHGHRRIAFIGDSLTTPTMRGRLAGYQDALRDAGIAHDDELIALGVIDRESSREALGTLMQVEDPPTATFASNGRLGMAFVPVAHAFPVDVISFGDFPLADALTPPLTTIDQDPALIGELAARRIFDRLARPSGRYKRKTVLQVRLVERESCHLHLPGQDSRTS